MTNNKSGSGFIKKLLLFYVLLDLVWAALVATFGATILSQIGMVGGAGEGATQAATILGWLITFIIAFFQGAIFLGVGTMVVFIFVVVFSSLFGGNGRTGS